MTPPVTPTSATPTTPTPEGGAAPVVAPVVAAADEGTVLGGAAAVVTDPAAPVVADPNAAPVVTVPEKYELALEGVTLDPALVTAADPVLRELGLSNEAANKLMPIAKQMMDQATADIGRQLQDMGAATRKEWHDAYVADPEIGGVNRTQTETLSAKALDAMGYTAGHPFRTLLNDSGIGNHPDMIRAFRRLGEMVGEEGTFLRADVAAPKSKSAAERLYPNG